MLAAALHRYFIVASSEKRIELAGVDRERQFAAGRLRHIALLRSVGGTDIELPCFPGPEPLGKLYWKTRGIGCRSISLWSQEARRLMMAVPVALRAVPLRSDYQRAKSANDANHVSEHRFPVPLGEGLFARLAEAEVEGAGEELYRAIHPSRGEQLIGANDAEQLIQLGAQQVLAAVAPCERQVRGARLTSLREVSQQSAVFVVRVGAGMKHAGDNSQSPDRLAEPDSSARFGRRSVTGDAANGGRPSRGDNRQDQS